LPMAVNRQQLQIGSDQGEFQPVRFQRHAMSAVLRACR
jgi:hypothetical protein